MDWAYLILLFALLIAIRFVLVFSLYPITARIGIGTNIKESVFMSYGGFRGSVGIALSLSLEARLYNNTEEGSEQRDNVDKVICFVGGISVLTLLINGMTSGPLLSKVSHMQGTSMSNGYRLLILRQTFSAWSCRKREHATGSD